MQEYNFDENLIPDYQNLYEKNLSCNFSAMEVYRKREFFKYNVIIFLSIILTLFVLAIVFIPPLREVFIDLTGVASETLIEVLAFYPLGLFIVFMALLKLDKSYRKTIKKHCLNSFLQKIANISRVDMCPPEVASLIKSTIKNSPRFSDIAQEITCDDVFLGEYEGVPFHIVESIIYRPMKLEEKRRVFYRGVILQIKPNFPICGITQCGDFTDKPNIWIPLVLLITGIVGTISTIGEQGLPRILIILMLFFIIGLVVWEGRRFFMMKKTLGAANDFSVTSNNPEERQLFVTPRLFKLLSEVQVIYNTPSVDCFINPDAISLFIKTDDDKFEFGSVKESLLSPDCGKSLYNQLNNILRLVKYFSGRSN